MSTKMEDFDPQVKLHAMRQLPLETKAERILKKHWRGWKGLHHPLLSRVSVPFSKT